MKQVLCFFMMLLVLFADAGQTIYAHTCLKSNNVSFSINAPTTCKAEQHVERKSCCAKKEHKQHNNTIEKKGCCSVSGKYVKAPIGTDNTSVTPLSVPMQAVIVSLYQLFTFQVAEPTAAISIYPSPPPLVYEHSQGYIQVFRI